MNKHECKELHVMNKLWNENVNKYKCKELHMMNKLWNENMNKHECKELHMMNELWNKIWININVKNHMWWINYEIKT